MSKLSILLILLGVMLVFFGANAQALSVQITPENYNLSLEAGQTINVPLSVINSGTEKECMDLYTKTYYDKLHAELAAEKICVAGKQTVKFSLGITAENDASELQYVIDVFAEQGNNQIASTSLNVDVYKTGNFEVNQKNSKDVFYNDGYTKYVSVIVTNLSDKKEKIEITADSEMFVPSFNPSIVHLNAFESIELQMQININDSTPTGVYEIPMYAKSLISDRAIERSAIVEIRNKNEVHEKAFDFKVIDDFVSMKRNETEFVRMEVTNLIDEKQKIRFMINSTLDYELMQKSVELEAFETEIIQVKIIGHEFYDDKEYHNIAYAYNDKDQLQDSFIVSIEGEHDVTAELKNNNIEARICSVLDLEVFEFEIINNGDYKEKIELKWNNSYNYIQVKASENDFYLKEGEKKTVRVTAMPGFDAVLGDKKIDLTVYASGKKVEEFELKFKVVADDSFEGLTFGVMNFVSYPKEITIIQGEEKTIEVTLTNSGKEKINGLISVDLRGTGYGLSAESENIYSLIAGESKTVKIKLIAEENAELLSFNGTLEAKSDKFAALMPVKINVVKGKENTEETEENSVLAGLFGLGGSLGAGIIVLIILMTVILILSLLSSEKEPRRFIVYKKKRGMYV
ncbi:MAG: hypothetical protein JW703_03730 [Candidatus Diapherotrites archaeon]|nr:hypothetical protein [Candidatus Diapherotrites archaeon]